MVYNTFQLFSFLSLVLVHLISPCILPHFRFSPTPTSASSTDARCPNRWHSVYLNLLHFTVLQSFYPFTFSHFSISLFLRLALSGFTAVLMSNHSSLICSCTTNHYFLAYWGYRQLGLLDYCCCGLICRLPRSTFRSFSWEPPFRRPFSHRFPFPC